jgi:hypothetical protein
MQLPGTRRFTSPDFDKLSTRYNLALTQTSRRKLQGNADLHESTRAFTARSQSLSGPGVLPRVMRLHHPVPLADTRPSDRRQRVSALHPINREMRSLTTKSHFSLSELRQISDHKSQ